MGRSLERKKSDQAENLKKRRLLTGAGIFVLLAIVLLLLFLPGETPFFYHSLAPLDIHPFALALIAFIPSLFLLVLMSVSRLRSISIALLSLGLSLILALSVWRMPPLLAGHSIFFGMSVAVLPLLWALLNAMWLFRLLVDSGFFDTLRQSLQRVSPDKRIQTILVGFGLTSLLESMAAFGAPIVIITSMLMGLGFPPHLAAAISLIADSAPSSWGTQGLPILMLSSVTGLDADRLGMIIGRQTPVIAALLPMGLVIMVAGKKGLKGVWPVAFLAGLGYGVTGVLSSQFLSVSITGMVSGIVSILVILLSLRFIKPRQTWLFPGEPEQSGDEDSPRRSDVVRAWSPFMVLIAVMGLANAVGLAKLVTGPGNLTFPWPKLNGAVYSVDPHTGSHAVYPAVFSQNLLTTSGTLTLIAGWISSPFLRLKPWEVLKSYGRTIKGMLAAGSTIACILGIAYLMNYSGMAASIGLAVSQVSASALPPLMVYLGLFGSIVAGSVSGGNALFGGASVFAAKRLGLDPHLIAGTLCSGGTLGKPITPQSLVLAEAAVGHPETDPAPKLISLVFGWALVYSLILFLMVLSYSLFLMP